jgi:pentatricopeptide repeat protein
MDAWSLSGLPNSAENAHALLEEMLQKYKSGDRDMKPGKHAFGIVITAWGRTNSKIGATKAQAVFEAMMSAFKSGHEDLRPDIIQYTALIDAWAKAGEPERAESILREMGSDKMVGVKPDAVSYNSVMHGWSRSGRPERAQALYDEMKQKSQAGNFELRPVGVTYNILVSAWLNHKRPDAVSNAQRVFDDMVASYKSGQRDLETCIDSLRDQIAKARTK